MPRNDPVQPADDAARTLARELISAATHAAIAVLQPQSSLPSVSRIALATDDRNQPVSLISSLAEHTRALQANPSCALLIGEPGEKGDPLTHPRLTLHCQAELIDRGTEDHRILRARYLSLRPKAKLYVDFTDFCFVRFNVSDGLLNGGFGKAFRLTPQDF